ncbi:MAG: hypothetical protein J0L84_10070 [Verrucomicrobia bacterium]|nr:hypothetical protein [Verrucomicrobiota bacterium]
MAESDPPAAPVVVPAPEAASVDAPALTELRLPVTDLPRVPEALARALGEAGVGGQELHALFGSGVRAACVGCGLPVSGAELGELAVTAAGERERELPAKLERLRLGYCPRNGCEARFFNLELPGPGRFDRGRVLGRTRDLLAGRETPGLSLRPVVSPATRRATQRLAIIALITLAVSFVVYRLTFYRTQPIPFVQPKSPFAIEPKSIDPNQR